MCSPAPRQTQPKITTYHAQAEHKPRHAEGPFLANLLDAVGYPDPVGGTNPAKRMHARWRTCLDGYDQTNFPRASDWRFTRFYVPQAVAGGHRLAHDAGLLWSAFERLHHSHGLPGPLEIPMESFTRAVEIVLKDSEVRDVLTIDAALWNLAVRSCGYIQSRQAVSASGPPASRAGPTEH